MGIEKDKCPYCNVVFEEHTDPRCKDVAFIYYKILEQCPLEEVKNES